ncbi:hypothetical protein CTAYLR_002874 [Chrysophaeum taylorii]|uniref:PNPLA domain-containing protein n=1 Tax=Chrysophaeum taylorii TaxID=2483200 RepID=A0AAD7U810_9STRA|nr:hypothetical protein CTAYLR_002874 [Chrysophaeum taylorii]
MGVVSLLVLAHAVRSWLASDTNMMPYMSVATTSSTASSAASGATPRGDGTLRGAWRKMTTRLSVVQRLGGAAAAMPHAKSLSGALLYIRGTTTARRRAAALAEIITPQENATLIEFWADEDRGLRSFAALLALASSLPVVRLLGALSLASGLASRAVEAIARRQRPLRVLCLDGGGMKGRNLLVMIRELERRAGKPVSELFDVVCGTSIGGCGALFVAKFGAAATARAEMAFKGLQERCFATSSRRRLFSEGQYCADRRADLVSELLGSEKDLSNAKGAGRPLAFVVAARRGPTGDPEPFLFRTYDIPGKKAATTPLAGTSTGSVVDAIVATSAAPTYFAPADLVDDDPFFDGGCVFNNPTLVCLHELHSVFPNRRVGTLVSLGCGRQPPTKTGRLIKRQTQREEAITHEYAKAHVEALPGAVYERFQPPLLTFISPSEHREPVLASMEHHTRHWLAQPAVSTRLDNIVAKLRSM